MSDENKNFSEQKLIEETNRLLEEVHADEDVMSAPVPRELMRQNIFREIRAREASNGQRDLSQEEQELIRLGKIYKKKKSHRKYYVIGAAAILAMAFGITSVGGPEKLLEKFSWDLAGRKQTAIDSKSGDVEKTFDLSEEEAYAEVEEKFGFTPVKLDYLPTGIFFEESVISDEIQNIKLIFGDGDKATICFWMQPNFRNGSWGQDIEDELVQSFEKEVCDTTIQIYQYQTEEGETRWSVRFEYENVGYSLLMMNVDQVKMEKIVENLFFS